MPFFWRRRNRYWWGTWRKQNRYKRRNYWRHPRRRRRRRTAPRRRRRYRRRRRKVRRKRQQIPVKQWQPDSIVKCHIKGNSVIVLGAHGKQLNCYTVVKNDNVPPKAPMGGGFGVERFSLQYLYEEHVFHNNIWTKSNILKDLCRYLWVKFRFYRHSWCDFIVQYERQPPFTIDKWTYPATHPHQLLQAKHKKIIISKSTKPTGRLTTKFKVKPPKQMLSKWFFSDHFTDYTLLLLRAAALELKFSYLGFSNSNQEISLFYLDQAFYANANWGAYSTTPYKPYDNIPPNFTYTYGLGNKTGTITPETQSSYDNSVSYEKGYFQPTLLQATSITQQSGKPTATTPINVARYNPNLDNGQGNKIYLTSILTKNYDPPSTDKSLLIENVPLWLGLYGFLSYVTVIKKGKAFLDSHCVILQSPAILPSSQIGAGKTYLPIDYTMINGKGPYNETVTTNMKKKWFPTVEKQMETLNAIVCAGPYIPKYNDIKEDTWELKFEYNFLFKWGGPQTGDQPVTNPAQQGDYDVPDHFQSSIQIQNPQKINTESILHAWDQRRGHFTKKAIKRMLDNLQIDTDYEPITDSPPKKKIRKGPQLYTPHEKEEEIETCLRSLCEENTFQEKQTEDLQHLIQQQQEQQFQLKRNLLILIADMKRKQTMLQLQTGLLE